MGDQIKVILDEPSGQVCNHPYQWFLPSLFLHFLFHINSFESFEITVLILLLASGFIEL